METSEHTIYHSNSFGKVTNKRVILSYKNGNEDIPVSQITSVSLQRRQNLVFAIGSFIAAAAVLIIAFGPGGGNWGTSQLVVIAAFVIAFILAGIANWLGHHAIVISTGGQNRRPIKVEMSKTSEGIAFVDAIRKAIFK